MMSNKEKESMISSEESIVYSQAIHYANRMVYMRIPLNVSELMPRTKPHQNVAALSSSKLLTFCLIIKKRHLL